MSETGVADFRSALRQAFEAARADGVPLEMQIALLVSELGHLVASWATDDAFEAAVANLQQAVAHATRTARDDVQYQDAVERFVDRWLN